MALFEKLASRVEQRARDAATVMIDRASAAYSAVPGVQSTRDRDELVVEGKRLARRWLTDARIRFGYWGGQ